MEKLREALDKHTNIILNTTEGQLILKDSFITQLAPNIRRKLHKLAISPKSTLESLKVAASVFYNRDQKEVERWNKRDQTKVMKMEKVILTVLQGPISLSGQNL